MWGGWEVVHGLFFRWDWKETWEYKAEPKENGKRLCFLNNSPLQEHREAPFGPALGPSDLAQEGTREPKTLSTVRAGLSNSER